MGAPKAYESHPDLGMSGLRWQINGSKWTNEGMTQNTPTDSRVAVLVDCDNTSPEVLVHALKVVAQFGRVVLRRGYGNHGTLANKWQEALVRLAFTPCLQYQYASGKSDLRGQFSTTKWGSTRTDEGTLHPCAI